MCPRSVSLVPLEILHFALVLLGCLASFECAEVFSLSGFCVGFL